MAFTVLKTRTTQATAQSGQTGLPTLTALDLVESTDAPSVNDDTSDGFVVGSVWNKIDSTGKISQMYIATGVTAGAATWKLLSSDLPGPGETIKFIEETVEFTADASANLVEQIPALAIPIGAVINYDTAVVLDTAVKIAVGTSGDPDGYAITGTNVTKNTKEARPTGALCGTGVLSATTVQVTAVDTNGAAAGTVTSGTVRVRVYYKTLDQLPNAA